MVVLPILNVAVTAVLIGVLIFVYADADGQTINYTRGGMKIPTLIALLITLLKMCIASGIG